MSPWLYIFCFYLKMVSQDLQPLAPSNPRDYNKFNILLVKVFSLKQKTNQILPATIEKKNQILSLQPLEYSGIFRNIQAHSEPCVSLAYSKPWHNENQRQFQNTHIFRTLAYSEFQYIQDPGILRTTGIFRTPAYLEPQYIQKPSRILKILVYSEPQHVEKPRHISNPVKHLQWRIL